MTVVFDAVETKEEWLQVKDIKSFVLAMSSLSCPLESLESEILGRSWVELPIKN